MITCSLCGGETSWSLRYRFDPAIERQLLSSGGTRTYGWFLCRHCGNGFPSFQPAPSMLAALWERARQLDSEDAEHVDAVWRHRQEISRKGAERSYAAFAQQSAVKPGRFIDIACGLGETVRVFSDHGWNACGIDADPSVEQFHRKLGIRSEIARIESAKLSGSFDMIHIAHAIYFIREPRQFLESLRSRLSEGGVLCLVVANFLATDDLSLPSYPHSFFPTAGSMRHLLSVAGYQVFLSRSISGSTYIAARVGIGTRHSVCPHLIRLGYHTKRLRYILLGVPKLWAHRMGKRLVHSVQNRMNRS